MNDGEYSSCCGDLVTFGGSSPDYVGYKFKLPATVRYVELLRTSQLRRRRRA